MYPLLAPLVWLFIMAILTGVVVIDKYATYRNTIVGKTFSWPFWVSSIIIILTTALAYNATSILFEGIAHRAIIQAVTTSVILVFLIVTIWLSLTGMARRFNAKLIELVENI